LASPVSASVRAWTWRSRCAWLVRVASTTWLFSDWIAVIASGGTPSGYPSSMCRPGEAGSGMHSHCRVNPAAPASAAGGGIS
jgi:hypothetical protein